MRFEGPVFKGYLGNKELARGYTGIARTLLGKLVNILDANNLQVGGRAVKLKDGTVIKVWKYGAIHKFFVDVTDTVVPPRPQYEPEYINVEVVQGFGVLITDDAELITWDSVETRWVLEDTQYYGNVDWTDGKGLVLSWWGPSSRYFDGSIPHLADFWKVYEDVPHKSGTYENIGPYATTAEIHYHRDSSKVGLWSSEIYSGGKLFLDIKNYVPHFAALTTNHVVTGAAVTVSPKGESFIVFVADLLGGDGIFSRPQVFAVSRDTGDAYALVTFYFLEVGNLNIESNQHPWFFNASGTRAVSKRWNVDGFFRYTIDISFDDEGKPVGAITKNERIATYRFLRVTGGSSEVVTYGNRDDIARHLDGIVEGEEVIALDFIGDVEVRAVYKLSKAEHHTASMTYQSWTANGVSEGVSWSSVGFIHALTNARSSEVSESVLIAGGEVLASSYSENAVLVNSNEYHPPDGELVWVSDYNASMSPVEQIRINYMDLRTNVIVYAKTKGSAQSWNARSVFGYVQGNVPLGESGSISGQSFEHEDIVYKDGSELIIGADSAPVMGQYSNGDKGAYLVVVAGGPSAGSINLNKPLDDSDFDETYHQWTLVSGHQYRAIETGFCFGSVVSSPNLGIGLSLINNDAIWIHFDSSTGAENPTRQELWDNHGRIYNLLIRPNGAVTEALSLWSNDNGAPVPSYLFPMGLV